MSKTIFDLAITQELKELSALAVEVWRLEVKLTKFGKSISADGQASIQNSIDKIKSYFDKKDFEVVDLTGTAYNDGLNVDILSVIESEDHSSLITETIEPMVKYQGKVLKRAKVIISK